MPYEYNLLAPVDAEVGTPVGVSLEVCCITDGGCPTSTGSYIVEIDGNRVINYDGFGSFLSAFCIQQDVGTASVGASLDSSPSFELEGGSVTFTETGDYTVSYPGGEHTISVTGQPDINIDGCSGSQSVQVGEPANVDVPVSNSGPVVGETVVLISDQSGVIGSQQATLQPGESKTVTFEVAYESTGEYQVEASLSQPSSFSVEVTDARVV